MRNFPSASSRERPSVVCVRSFVPNEKKSAYSAISSARTHARGSSIIVPTGCVDARRLLGPHSLGQLAQPAQLFGEADERVHDLDERRVAGPLARRRGPRARSRAPASRRSPGTGARAGSRACRASGSPRAARGSAPASARRSPRPRGGRNSCSGGSSRRIVTGRPAIASKISSKSACWNGQQPVERSAPVGFAVRQDHLLHDRQPLVAEEHVLGAAEADALRAELAGARRRPRACRRSRAPRAGGARRPSRGSSRSPR